MSEIGDVFSGDSSVSASKLDAKTFLVCNGTKIAALLGSQAVAAAIPTATAGGFTLNTPVFRKTDGTGWLPFFQKHLHAQDIDSDGGSYFNIRKANSGMIIAAIITDNGSSYYSEFTGTGANIAQNTQTGFSNILVNSGTSSGAYASIFVSSVKLDFSKPAILTAKINEVNGTSILTRWGVGMEKVQNSTDNLQKFGCEGCDANGTDFQLAAADGTGRSMIDSLTPIATSTKCLKIIFTPGANVQLLAGSGGTVATLSTNCPSTGSLANENQLLRFGVKASAVVGASRQINLFGAQLYGSAINTDWF